MSIYSFKLHSFAANVAYSFKLSSFAANIALSFRAIQLYSYSYEQEQAVRDILLLRARGQKGWLTPVSPLWTTRNGPFWHPGHHKTHPLPPHCFWAPMLHPRSTKKEYSADLGSQNAPKMEPKTVPGRQVPTLTKHAPA